MTSHASGDLVYWNEHTGFGEIDLDEGQGRIAIYRADLLRAGVKTPRVGDRFYISTGAAAPIIETDQTAAGHAQRASVSGAI